MTRFYRWRALRAALQATVAIMLGLGAVSAHADAIYSYTGNPVATFDLTSGRLAAASVGDDIGAAKPVTIQVSKTSTFGNAAQIIELVAPGISMFNPQVWQTNISGIGAKVTLTAPAWGVSNAVISTVPTGQSVLFGNSVGPQSDVWTFMIQLVKTGDIGVGNGNSPLTSVSDNLDPPFEGVNLAIQTHVIPQTCRVSASPATVQMGSVNPSQLTVQGDTAGSASFQVMASDCGTATPAHMWLTFADQNDTGSTQSYLKNTGSAQNVGIQMSTGSGVVQMRTPISLSPDTNITIPMTARYYDTGGQATVGSVDADAVFNVDYD